MTVSPPYTVSARVPLLRVLPPDGPFSDTPSTPAPPRASRSSAITIYSARPCSWRRASAPRHTEEILVSESVVDLCTDREVFQDRGSLALKGFNQPQHAAAVNWRHRLGMAG